MVQWERTCARIPGLFLGNRDSSKVIDALDNAEGWTIIFQSLVYRKKNKHIFDLKMQPKKPKGNNINNDNSKQRITNNEQRTTYNERNKQMQSDMDWI